MVPSTFWSTVSGPHAEKHKFSGLGLPQSDKVMMGVEVLGEGGKCLGQQSLEDQIDSTEKRLRESGRPQGHHEAELLIRKGGTRKRASWSFPSPHTVLQVGIKAPDSAGANRNPQKSFRSFVYLKFISLKIWNGYLRPKRSRRMHLHEYVKVFWTA
ncbi:hypothetical protein B0H17DRAFT_1142310 [Mycena rosella]|uniref:Uncharacterized protein n=1 Tax=Mycena rosella TaxID=1033263 RepID=A0AAD7D1B9_MYCRO|nr:hypothetical protein B0H17DRAFT_1142310 [Mycena rosella]